MKEFFFDWGQTIAIISTVLASAWAIHKDVMQDIKSQGKRIDRLYEIFLEERDKQAQRTDALYQMFIDLLKEGKK